MSDRISIGAELQSLPLGQMLQGPLEACVEAQAMSAAATADFIEQVGIEEDGSIRTVDFSMNRVFTDEQTGIAQTRTVDLEVPFLSIVEAPHISIDKLQVDFEFKVRDTLSTTASNSLSRTADTATDTTTKSSRRNGAISRFFRGPRSSNTKRNVRTKMNVSMAAKRNRTSEASREATFTMTMHASQRVPEGFQRVMGIFADAISSQTDAPT